MICTGHGNCHQGRRECSTPIQCSGASAETESAIRLHRAMNAPIARDPITFAEPEPEEFTQGEALTFCETAIRYIVGAAAVVVLTFMAVQLWPVVAAALH